MEFFQRKVQGGQTKQLHRGSYGKEKFEVFVEALKKSHLAKRIFHFATLHLCPRMALR